MVRVESSCYTYGLVAGSSKSGISFIVELAPEGLRPSNCVVLDVLKDYFAHCEVGPLYLVYKRALEHVREVLGGKLPVLDVALTYFDGSTLNYYLSGNYAIVSRRTNGNYYHVDGDRYLERIDTASRMKTTASTGKREIAQGRLTHCSNFKVLNYGALFGVESYGICSFRDLVYRNFPVRKLVEGAYKLDLLSYSCSLYPRHSVLRNFAVIGYE